MVTLQAKTVAYPVPGASKVREELVSLEGFPTIALDPYRVLTTVGRKGADAIVDHEEVSRFHAELRRTDDGSVTVV
jgi:hypothetical protein